MNKEVAEKTPTTDPVDTSSNSGYVTDVAEQVLH